MDELYTNHKDKEFIVRSYKTSRSKYNYTFTLKLKMF